MKDNYDLVVIGGGPGGYEAAIRGAQLGMSVACIEKRIHNGKPSLGGTCLNVGCIPSKALLDSSHRFHSTQHELAEHGINTGEVSIDLDKMHERKDAVVDKLTGGVDMLLQANGVEWLKGTGKLINAQGEDKVISFTPHDGADVNISAKNVILATGSVPIYIPVAPVDNDRIVDSTGALSIPEIPKRLGVIGAGVIGLELGSVWSRLGSEVVIFEASDHFLPFADKGLAKESGRIFKKQGLDIRLGATVSNAASTDGTVTVNYEQKGSSHTEEFDYLIVCVGRKAYTESLLASDCGLVLTDRGQIEVNDFCLTSQAGVYAIGDLVRGPMLAHKAMEEGMMAVERIAGHKPQVNYDTIISVVYTHPEIAWVGLNEEQAKEAGYDIKVGSFSLAVNGRALAASEATGSVKLVADSKTDRVLGMHMVGANAGEIVHQGMISMEFGSSIEDLQLMTFAHPTISEAVHEAALAADGRAIHAVQRKRR